jgi:hypothetical protein
MSRWMKEFMAQAEHTGQPMPWLTTRLSDPKEVGSLPSHPSSKTILRYGLLIV